MSRAGSGSGSRHPSAEAVGDLCVHDGNDEDGEDVLDQHGSEGVGCSQDAQVRILYAHFVQTNAFERFKVTNLAEYERRGCNQGGYDPDEDEGRSRSKPEEVDRFSRMDDQLESIHRDRSYADRRHEDVRSSRQWNQLAEGRAEAPCRQRDLHEIERLREQAEDQV